MQGVRQLQSVLKELLEVHDDGRLSSLCEHALQLLEDLPSIDCTQKEGKTMALQLHTSGISLWNKTVALKSAGAIALNLNAQMRHISCTLVLLSNPLEPTQANILKQITMATKTGRAWLDCDNPAMAETSLTLASDCWEKLRSKFPDVTKEHAKAKALFRVLCFRAEACVGLEQHEVAMTFVQQAKDLLNIADTETAYLAMLCYNFGLDQFQKGPSEDCITWLKESYEIGRGCPNLGAPKRARTLRLLANAFLDWDGCGQWQKALNAVSLANSEHSHPAGFLLKTSILLQHDGGNERLGQAYETTLQHPDLSMDMALSTVRLASNHDRVDLCFSGLTTLTRRFQNTPEIYRIHLLHMEMLLKNGRLSEAKQLMEDCITAHNTGAPIDVKFCKQFHLVLWEQASQASMRNEYGEAVMWYNYSLSLFSGNGERDKNIAKLQRNRCSCYLNLEEYEKATEAIHLSKGHDPDNPQTHFLIFKLAVFQGEIDKAVESLSTVVSTSSTAEGTGNGLICLAAQLAFEHSNRDLAVLALEKLVSGCGEPQIFIALRCLIRLKLTLINSETSADKIVTLSSMLNYIQTAHSKLSLVSSPISREKEAIWFLKVAWNLALQCGDNYHEMREFFVVCHSLSECVSVDPTVLLRQKTCQLMAAAASVNCGRKGGSDTRMSKFKSVLEHVSKCRLICKQLGTSNGTTDPTPSLLALYEFESKLELGHTDMDSALARITSLPGLETKTLETIAALCVRACQPGLAVQALKLAIQQHMKSGELDGEKLSKCYHSLVQLVMGSESSCDMASKEQARIVLTEVLDLLETKAKDSFPEMEVLWLLAKCWNCGIHLYSTLRFKESELWCSLGLRFLNHLSQLRANYEEQMTTVYTKVLQKVQSDSIHLHTLQ